MLGLTEKEKTSAKAAKEAKRFIGTLAEAKSSHLDEYLAYYVAQKEPGYAVLVTGEWGTGKTFQVKRVLPKDYAYYVSLYGLTTPDEIESQVFAAMAPTKAALKDIGDNFKDMSIGAAGFELGGVSSALSRTFIKNTVDNSRPLILDDLERCKVDGPALLGIINRYVEHFKCRVIVIAHDEKIVGTLQDSKEKIFGQTIRVEPNVEAAFHTFVEHFSKQYTQDLLGERKADILAIYRESGISSLRILRHVVEDVLRLLNALSPDHRQNASAMVEVVRLFSAVAIEFRSNRLAPADLVRRRERIYVAGMPSSRSGEAEQPKFPAAAARYKSVDLASETLQDGVLIDMLVDGRYEAATLEQSLNASSYFLKSDTAPWQIVINFDKLDDSTVAQALTRMDAQFQKRDVVESGEMLHIFALKFLMAARRISKDSIPKVLSDCKAYIDDLLSSGRLPPRLPGQNWFDTFATSYQHVRYWIDPSYQDAFSKVLDHLLVARGQALKAQYPALAGQLLKVLEADGRKFLDTVCHTYQNANQYDDIPILAEISAKDFVDSWLKSPKDDWFHVANALKQRRDAGVMHPNMVPERIWVPKVVREMKRRGMTMTGFEKLRWERVWTMLAPPPAAKAPAVKKAAAAKSTGRAPAKKVPARTGKTASPTKTTNASKAKPV